MPKSPVTDPITDQEIAFAHLLLSGTMNDREAAEAAGLNPNTAAYSKCKPRIREYMDQHRAAVSQKLVEQEAEGLRRLNIGRDQMLARLWELANLSPAETRGSIAGQVKAMAMLLTIEGLFPDRRLSSAPSQPAAPAMKPNIYVSKWMRQRPDETTEPNESVTSTEADPATPSAQETPPATVKDDPSQHQDHVPVGPDNPSAYPKDLNWVPNAIGPSLDDYPKPTGPFRPPLVPRNLRFGRGR